MSNTQGRAQQRREVSSSAHPGRPCQPCIPCKKGNLSKYFHPKTIKDKASLEKLRQLEPMLAIEPSSCICRNCRDDLSKLSESSFIPRWRENRERSECSVPECSIFPQKVTKLVTMEQICTIFSMSNPEPPNDETGYPRCATHYGELYRYLHPVNKNCRTCNKRLIERSKFRKCPNPTVIQRFLHENTPFTGDIHAEDIVCIACYKAHLVILKHSSDTVQSLDQDLADAIKNLVARCVGVSKAPTVP